MKFRPVFINASNNLRAGWRIAIFILLQVTLSYGILGLVRVVVAPYLGIPHISGTVLTGIGYLILIGTTFIVLRLVDHRPFHSVGLPRHPRMAVEWSQGFLISFLMITAVFLIEFLAGYVQLTWRGQTLTALAGGAGLMLAIFLWFGFGEELLFRGYCFQALIEGTNRYVAVAVLSIFFGAAHLGNPNATFFGVANTILAGILLSVAYLRTRTLWLPTSMHATWNFFQGFVYSFPVSGKSLGEHSLFTLEQGGPDWVTGGAYGPEAGILATVVLVLGTVYTLMSKTIRIGDGIWEPVREPQPPLSQPAEQA